MIRAVGPGHGLGRRAQWVWGPSLDHGPQPARQNDRERFELLGFITSL